MKRASEQALITAMSMSIANSILHRLCTLSPLLLYAATWTVLLTMTVSVALFTPELAFVSAASPHSSFSRSCNAEGFIRIPLDLPGESPCLPAHLFKRSGFDFFMPTLFAALAVIGSACVLRALGWWDDDST